MIARYLLLRPRGEDGQRQITRIVGDLVNDFEPTKIATTTLLVPRDAQVVSHAPAECAVVGPLFRRSDDSRVTRLTTGEGYSIAADRGRYLLRNFWGGYIAVIAGEGLNLDVIRDPSASVPSYWSRTDDLDIVFSDVALARRAGFALDRIAWDALAHRLRYPSLRIAASCIAGVAEIVPGSRLTFGADVAATQLWSPWDFTDDAPVMPAIATEAVRDTVMRCVGTWGRAFDRVHLELSGGLDSSIVAAAVKGHPAWSATTFATDRADGDERHFARAVALRCGVGLREIALDEVGIDPSHPPAALRPNPGGFSGLAGIDTVLARAANEAHADAIFTGGGGDNVFCTVRSAAPVVDAWRQSGARQAWATLRDVATLGEESLTSAAGHAWRQFLRARNTPVPWRGATRLLGSGAEVNFAGHPWLEAPADALPGKRAHVTALLRILPFLDGYDRMVAVPTVAPLMAQPVMETCLAIPSWQWIAGGCDRAVARRAFADLLPPEIIARRGKGSLASTLAPVFDTYRETLLALLEGGVLASHGLIDEAAVWAALRASADKEARYIRLFEFADAELWARSIAHY